MKWRWIIKKIQNNTAQNENWKIWRIYRIAHNGNEIINKNVERESENRAHMHTAIAIKKHTHIHRNERNEMEWNGMKEHGEKIDGIAWIKCETNEFVCCMVGHVEYVDWWHVLGYFTNSICHGMRKNIRNLPNKQATATKMKQSSNENMPCHERGKKKRKWWRNKRRVKRLKKLAWSLTKIIFWIKSTRVHQKRAIVCNLFQAIFKNQN